MMVIGLPIDPIPPEGNKSSLGEQILAQLHARNSVTADATQVLLHELQVHQIELELQNEALRVSQNALEQSKERIFDLYDHAPVGYCSVSEAGLLLHANLTLASLVGIQRGALAKQPQFTTLLCHEDQDIWYQMRKCLLESGQPQTRELRLHRNDTYPGDDLDSAVWVQLTATQAHDSAGQAVLRIAVTDISLRKQAQAQQMESEARWRVALEGVGDGMWDWNIQTGKAFYSHQYKAMLGYADADIGTSSTEWSQRIHPDDAAGVLAALQPYLDGMPGTATVEFRMRRKDGLWQWTLGRGMVVERTAQGKPLRMIGINTDLTARKLTEAKLQLAASVFEHTREGIMVADAQGRILDVNAAFTRITGYSRDEVLGQNPRLLSSGRQDHSFYAALWKALADQGYWSGEVWNRRKNGEVYAELLTISAVRRAQSDTQQYVGLFSDISGIKAQHERLEKLAHFDVLTHLPNRLLLADRLEQAMMQAQRRGSRMAVVYLDLDGFKTINDSYGHGVGDQYLVSLACAMKDALREGDTLARMGGDEFVAVLIDLEATDSCVPMLARLLAAASEPVHMGELHLQGSASLGVSFYPQGQDVDADQLLRQADKAMYQAKAAGRNRYHLFDIPPGSLLHAHESGLARIGLALERQEFVLHYQPKVNMRTGRVIGAEALIRWQHPERGLLLPEFFLPVVESEPLAIAVGEWVLNAVLDQIEAWHAQGLNLTVSINVGARQLLQPGFIDCLGSALAAHPPVQPIELEIEVREAHAMQDIAQVSQVIQKCAHMGVGFTLDHSGTGYASLAYMERLRVSRLKIDQSFVRESLDHPADTAVLQGIIGLATAFKWDVIAQGVETAAHCKQLLALGCDIAQGYRIAPPMAAEQLSNWLAHWNPEADWMNAP